MMAQFYLQGPQGIFDSGREEITTRGGLLSILERPRGTILNRKCLFFAPHSHRWPVNPTPCMAGGDFWSNIELTLGTFRNCVPLGKKYYLPIQQSFLPLYLNYGNSIFVQFTGFPVKTLYFLASFILRGNNLT